MGFELYSHGRYLGCNQSTFPTILKVACSNGWSPRGTEPPYGWEGHWDGGYCWNERQYVTDDDALGIANALELALDDAPDEHVLPERTPENYLDFDEGAAEIQWLRGRSGYIREFIAFCRLGGFTIA
jgi:hypothetical protein